MPCCSDITKDIRSYNNIFDHIFKAIFCIGSIPLIMVSSVLKNIFPFFKVFYFSLIFFNRKFYREIYSEVIDLNSMKLNCKIASRLHMVSPRLAGSAYKNFGLFFILITMACIFFGVYWIWRLIH